MVLEYNNLHDKTHENNIIYTKQATKARDNISWNTEAIIGICSGGKQALRRQGRLFLLK